MAADAARPARQRRPRSGGADGRRRGAAQPRAVSEERRARQTAARTPRPEHLEPRESVHGLDRRGSVGAGRGRGAPGRPGNRARRRAAGRRLHLGAQARDPHRMANSRGAGPAVAPGGARLATQRAPLRCAAGTQQGADCGPVRRGAGEDLAPQLRHPAAAAERSTTRAIRATTGATRRSTPPSCRPPSRSRTLSRACCRAGNSASPRRCAPVATS